MMKRLTAVIVVILSVSLLGACTPVTNKTTPAPETSAPAVPSSATALAILPVPDNIGLTSMIKTASINGLALSFREFNLIRTWPRNRRNGRRAEHAGRGK
jgi:hypothetical protein